MKTAIRQLVLTGSFLALFVLPVLADPVLFVSGAGGTIYQTTLDGASLQIFISSIGGQAAGLAVDGRTQTLYVADYYPNSLVYGFAADGTLLRTLTPGDGPVGMAFDASGNLFVSNQRANTIHEFAPDGTDLGDFATGLVAPWGLAFDSAGTLYVANRGNNTVTMYAVDGTALGVFTSTGLDQPIGIAFDADGNLFVASWGNSGIRKFTSSGDDDGVFADSTVGVNAPSEIAFDAVGNLYVANWGDASVVAYAPDGSLLWRLAALQRLQGIAIMDSPSPNQPPTALGRTR
jgi:DNA-binding beta-propeller fold protein YncE